MISLGSDSRNFSVPEKFSYNNSPGSLRVKLIDLQHMMPYWSNSYMVRGTPYMITGQEFKNLDFSNFTFEGTPYSTIIFNNCVFDNCDLNFGKMTFLFVSCVIKSCYVLFDDSPKMISNLDNHAYNNNRIMYSVLEFPPGYDIFNHQDTELENNTIDNFVLSLQSLKNLNQFYTYQFNTIQNMTISWDQIKSIKEIGVDNLTIPMYLKYKFFDGTTVNFGHQDVKTLVDIAEQNYASGDLDSHKESPVQTWRNMLIL